MLTAHFTRAFAAPEPDPERSDPAAPLTWDTIQNWETSRQHCAHHHIPDAEETSILKQLWRAMNTVRHRDQVEAELTEMNGYCPRSRSLSRV